MKKYMIMLAASVLLMSAAKKDSSAITKEDGAFVVNTTTLCKSVEGYNGPVPVKIYIRKNKVEKIEVLKSQEGPKYVAMVKKQILHAWDGLTVKKARAQQVDAVTGATFTSEALIKNVQQGLDHYLQNK
ncbi:MAG: FMN-binding protein [Prevotella sp.]|nr:FMN-binding protein [Prevotella sp.]